MGSNSNNFARNKSSRNAKKYILLFREGKNSEPTYLKMLMPFKDDICIYSKVSLKNEGIGHSLEPFIKKCKSTYDNIPSKDLNDIVGIWFVFDDDTRTDNTQYLNALCSQKLSRTLFGGKPLYVAYSSMTIEYWILLHFRDHNGRKIYQSSDPDHSKRIIGLIDAEIVKYNNANPSDPLPLYGKSVDWLENNFNFFTRINTSNPLKFSTPKPRLVEAVVRAKRLHDQKIASGNEFAESVTTFYKLLEYLGVVKYKYKDPGDGKTYDVLIEGNNYFYKKGKEPINLNYSDIWDSAYLNER